MNQNIHFKLYLIKEHDIKWILHFLNLYLLRY